MFTFWYLLSILLNDYIVFLFYVLSWIFVIYQNSSFHGNLNDWVIRVSVILRADSTTVVTCTRLLKQRKEEKTKKKKEAFLPVTFFCDAMKYLSRLRCFSNLLTGFVTFLETGSHLYSIKNWNKITFLLRKSSFKNSRNRNQFFLFLTTTYIHYCLCLLSNLLKVRKWLVDLTKLCL